MNLSTGWGTHLRPLKKNRDPNMNPLPPHHYLIDTSFLVALQNKRDQYYSQSKKVFKELVQQKTTYFYLSDFILDEAFTLVQARTQDFRICQQILQVLPHIPRFNLVYMTRHRFEQTWHVFQKYFSRGLSFTDAFNVQLCNELNIPTILTFDSHYSGILETWSSDLNL